MDWKKSSWFSLNKNTGSKKSNGWSRSERWRSNGVIVIFIFKPSRKGRVVKCAVLRHCRLWVWVPAQTSVPPMLVDMSDGCKYVGQNGLAAMLYTWLYSVHLYWWKRQVSYQMWPSGSLHTGKKESRREIYSGFETREEGHTKSKIGAISGSTNWAFVQQKLKKKIQDGVKIV